MSTKAQQNSSMGWNSAPPLKVCALLRKLVSEAFPDPLSSITVCAVHAVSVFNVYLHDDYLYRCCSLLLLSFLIEVGTPSTPINQTLLICGTYRLSSHHR